MWDLLGPGLEPVSPALAGRFLTTEPPGKPLFLIFNKNKEKEIQLFLLPAASKLLSTVSSQFLSFGKRTKITEDVNIKGSG